MPSWSNNPGNAEWQPNPSPQAGWTENPGSGKWGRNLHGLTWEQATMTWEELGNLTWEDLAP